MARRALALVAASIVAVVMVACATFGSESTTSPGPPDGSNAVAVDGETGVTPDGAVRAIPDGAALPDAAGPFLPPAADASTCTRSNGFGDLFVSCESPGTHTQATATDACQAYLDSRPNANKVFCALTENGPCAMNAIAAYLRIDGGPAEILAIWDFSGPAIGHAAIGAVCPSTQGALWGYQP